MKTEQECGGILIAQGNETVWWFGWNNPAEDPTLQEEANRIVGEMPSFRIEGSWKADKRKVCLWDIAKKVTGNHLPCYHQSVGSCVGQGKAKAEHYTMCFEVAAGEAEQVIMPYEPYGYAQSRVCAGIRGNGDGSTGSGAAEAAKKYGVLRSDLPDLPKWSVRGQTVYWPGEVDRSWGRSGADQKWIEQGSRHLIKTAAQLTSADQMAEAIQNGYACTIASNWGGMMQPPVVGNPAVRLNRRTTTWHHQMMVCGWWDHPELGELYYISNSWAEDAHGSPAGDEPPGGFWVKKSEMETIVRQRESFAFSIFDGFPADPLDWVFYR